MCKVLLINGSWKNYIWSAKKSKMRLKEKKSWYLEITCYIYDYFEMKSTSGKRYSWKGNTCSRIGNPWELGMMVNMSNSYENQTFVGKTTEQVVKDLRKAGKLRTADSQ